MRVATLPLLGGAQICLHQGRWRTLSAGLLVAQCANPRKTIWQRLTAEGPYPCYRLTTIIRNIVRKNKHILKVQNVAFCVLAFFLREAFFEKMKSLGKTYVPHDCFHRFLFMLIGFHVFPHGVSCFPFFPFYPFPKNPMLRYKQELSTIP